MHTLFNELQILFFSSVMAKSHLEHIAKAVPLLGCFIAMSLFRPKSVTNSNPQPDSDVKNALDVILVVSCRGGYSAPFLLHVAIVFDLPRQRVVSVKSYLYCIAGPLWHLWKETAP